MYVKVVLPNMKKLFVSIFALSLFVPQLVSAQGTLVSDQITIVKARVTTILAEEQKSVPGTDIKTAQQTIKAVITEGVQQGKEVIIENDYLNLEVDEIFFVTHTQTTDGKEFYAVKDPYRLSALWFFVGLFIVVVIAFGGIQGVRGLISLFGSFALIVYVLLPGILYGYSPVLLSILVSSLIVVLGSYITHGFNKTTSAAVVGMLVTILMTGALAYFAVDATRLTGYESDEATYLNFSTRGAIDFVGLLLGGILIGLLGVLYDAAIGQALIVEELHKIAPHVSRWVVFKRALRVGREHIGALVNTLAIAYVGTSLPLLLLFYTANSPLGLTANQEVFATEVIRAMIGSIGLVLAVPITTLIAIFMLMKPQKADAKIVSQEEHALEHADHGHRHSH